MVSFVGPGTTEYGPGQDPTDPTSPGYQMGSRKSEHQYGLIYDLLCEGEIGGLVNGLASIYLNNTPMANGTALAASGPRVGSSTTTANNASVTVKTGFSQGLSLTQGKRYINIMNAAATGAIDGALPIGATTINTTTNIFTSDMDDDIILAQGIKQARTSILPRYVSIPNAGPGGATGRYLLLSYTDANTIEIFPGLHTAISSGNKIHVDYIGEITNISGTTLTVSPNVPRAVTHAPSQISQRLTNGGIADDFNFENVSGDFKTGARNQILPAQGAALGVPSASFTNAPNLDLQWTQGFTSRSLESSATVASGQQAPQIINPTSSSINLTAAQAREADSVRLVIEFPGGLIGRSDEGDEQLAYATFQVFLRYKTKSTDSAYKKLLSVGPANPGAWTAHGSGSYRYNQDDGGGGTVTGKTNTAFVIEHVIDLTPVKPFDDWYIEIKRTTPSTQKDYVNGEAFPNEGFTGMAKLKFIEIMIMDKLSYPKSAYGIVNFSARDFPTPPTRAYHIRGKKIKVPSNYITREEINYGSPLSQEAKYTRNTSTGVDTGSYVNWDGNFRGDDSLAGTHINRFPVYCNNPAWVFYDLLTNKDYGLGQHLNAADIDKYSLYQIARYCDEMVPDGKGGLEPRFTANVYLSKVEEAYKVLKDMASIFRGMLIWMDGQLTPVQDRPKEPIYTFTTANVKDGLFSYEYTGTKARPNQVNVTYNDPEQNYKQTVLTVDDIDNIIETGKIVKKDTIAFGCTSAGQAQRLGHWVIKTDTLETELLSFTTSVGAGFLRPGDIINVQDRKLDSIDFGGRLSTGSTTTSIKLDRGVELQSGQSYELYIFFPEPGTYLQQDAATINGVSLVRGDLILVDKDGNAIDTEEKAANLLDDSNNSVFTYYSKEGRLEKKSITTGAGTDISTITVSSAYSSAPPSEIIWAISNVNDLRTDAPVKFRVLAVVEDDDHTWSISAVRYVEEKYDEIEKKFLLPQDQYKATPDKNAEVPAPTGLRITMIPSAGIVGQSSGNEFITTVAWNSPVVAGSNPFYKYNAGYELLHFFEAEAHSKGTVVRLSAGQHSKTFTNVPSGTYTVKVRTVNTAGQVSKWTTVRQEVKPSEVPSSAFLRAGKLVFGGQVTSPAEITSGGAFKFTKANFRFVSPSKTFMDQSGTMTALDFSSLSNGQSAYVYFDASVPGFIAAQLHTDNVVKDAAGDVINATYWKTLGAANNGLSALSQGTVSTAIGSNVVTGNGTDFDTDFSVGDLIKVSTNSAPGTQLAGSEYNEIVSIISDTEMHCATNFTKAQTGYGFKQLFKPDFAGDCIAALVEKASDAYTYKAYATLTGEDGLEGSDAKVVHLESTDYSIVYNSAGSSPQFNADPSDANKIKVTASSQGYTAPEYRFLKDGSEVQAFSTTATHSITYAGTTHSNTDPSDVIKVEVREGSSGTSTADDSISIFKVKSGNSAVTSHEVTIYKAVQSSTSAVAKPAAPTAAVYRFHDSTFTGGLSGWSKQWPGNSYRNVVWAISATPQASVDITNTTTDTLAQSDWSNAIVVDRPRDTNVIYQYTASGTSNSTPSSGPIANSRAASIPTGWYDSPAAAKTARDNAGNSSTHLFLWSSVGSIEENYTEDNGFYTDATNQWVWGAPKRLEGQDSYTVVMSNASHTFPAGANGAVSSTANSGTFFEVLRGGQNLTPIDTGTPGADEFKVTAAQSGGNNINVSSANGTANTTTKTVTFPNYTAGNIMSGTSVTNAEITYTIAISSGDTAVTDTKVQTFTKVSEGEQGEKGDDGAAGPKVAELELYYKISGWTYGNNANWPSTPSTGTYNFATDTLSNIPSGWSRNKSTTKGSLNSISRALVTESSTENVSNSITWGTPSFSDEGVGDTNFIFKYMSSAGSAPGGTSYPNIPSGWSDSIPNNPNDGTKLFSSKGTAALSGSGTNFQFNYTWQTPVLHVQDKADISLGSVENKSSASIRSEIDANDLAGSGKAFSTLPESGATVGATVGTNFFKPGTTTNYNTNEFQNEDLAISAGSNGVFTLNRGVSSTTTTITKSNLGLNYTDGADVTSANTSADTAKVNGVAAGTISGGADRANNAIDSNYRITGSLYNGSTARTISDILGARDRAYAAIDANNRITANLYSSTYGAISPANIYTGATRANNAIDSSNRITGNIYDGTNSISPANIYSGATRANAGLSSSGDVNRAVPQAQLGNVNTYSVDYQVVTWNKVSNAGYSPSNTSQAINIKWKRASDGAEVCTSRWTPSINTTSNTINSVTPTANVTGSGCTASSQTGAGTAFSTVTFTRNGVSVTVTAKINVLSGFTFKSSGG